MQFRSPKSAALAAIAFHLLVTPACADSAVVQKGFYQNSDEGWFWYHDPVEPEEDEKPPTPPDNAASPPPLSSAWLKQNLPTYLNRAVDEPTDANVKAYLYLQKLALNKATIFTDAFRDVVAEDPKLSENTARPLVTAAASIADDTATQKKTQILQSLSAKAGVLFFFRSDCPYCKAEAPILEAFQTNTGISLYPVSIDGAGLPENKFANFATDHGQSQALGVEATPALYLAVPPNTYVPLTQGAISLAELGDRVLRAANKAGLIDDQTYESTQPAAAHPSAVALGSSPVPDDPTDLISLLNAEAPQ